MRVFYFYGVRWGFFLSLCVAFLGLFFFLRCTLYKFVNVRSTVLTWVFGMVTVTCQAYQSIKCYF